MAYQDNLNSVFIKNEYKLTSKQSAVVDVLTENKEKYLTVEEIYKCTKKIFNKIGRATVYRTVAYLAKIKVLYKIKVNNQCSKYELIDKQDKKLYWYLVCTDCGKITKIERNLQNEIENKIQKNFGFIIENYSIIFYGKCMDCINKTV